MLPHFFFYFLIFNFYDLYLDLLVCSTIVWIPFTAVFSTLFSTLFGIYYKTP